MNYFTTKLRRLRAVIPSFGPPGIPRAETHQPTGIITGAKPSIHAYIENVSVIIGLLALIYTAAEGFVKAFETSPSNSVHQGIALVMTVVLAIVIWRQAQTIWALVDDNTHLRTEMHDAQQKASLLDINLAVANKSLADSERKFNRALKGAQQQVIEDRASLERTYRLTNANFLLLQEARFTLVHALAIYQAAERTLYRSNIGLDRLQSIRESLSGARDDLHKARLNSLTETCNHVKEIFSTLKSTDVCANIKFVVYNPMQKTNDLSEAEYLTIARSDNTNPNRKSLHRKLDGSYIPYKFIENAMLTDLVDNVNAGHLVIDNIDEYVRSKARRDPAYKWPNERSGRFYRSALVVPIWHGLTTEFVSKTLITTLYKEVFRAVELEKDEIKFTCYGFLTIDSRKDGVFNHGEDVEILNECALVTFTNLFEIFAIQFGVSDV